MLSMSRSDLRSLKDIFVAKIHKNLSNIHKGMALCAKWHSQVVKGYWVIFYSKAVACVMFYVTLERL